MRPAPLSAHLAETASDVDSAPGSPYGGEDMEHVPLRPLGSPPETPRSSRRKRNDVAVVTTKRGTSRPASATKTVKVHDLSPVQPKTHAFIRLIGKPYLPAGQSQDPDQYELEIDPISGFAIKSPSLRRLPSPDTTTIVDMIDAENEDPFTLDSFASLLALHTAACKDFILARVITVDPHDESRLYASYYAAHHINKVLFRTQPEEGLLHRMKAKNPLNNMTIVGDVHYYVISSHDKGSRPALDSVKEVLAPRPATAMSRYTLDAFKSAAVSTVHKMTFGLTSPRAHTLDKAETWDTPPSGFRKYRSEGGGTYRHSIDVIQKSSNQKGEEEDQNAVGHDLRRSQRYFDAVLRHLDAPRPVMHVKLPPVEEMRDRSSHLARGEDLSDQVPALLSQRGSPSKDVLRKKLSVSTSKKASRRSSRGAGHRPKTADDAKTDDMSPVTPPDLTDFTSPPSSATRRRASTRVSKRRPSLPPSTKATPLSPRHHFLKRHHALRALSYLNDVASPTLASPDAQQPDSPSVIDWIKKHFEEQGPVSAQPTSPSIYRQWPLPLDLQQKMPSPISPHTADQMGPLFFQARYYATDDDFLMQARVRAYFKENALSDEDAVLFTIAANQIAMPQAPPELTPHPHLPGFEYGLVDNGQHPMHLSSSQSLFGHWRFAARKMQRSPYFRWIALLYLVGCIAVIKFVVPSAYLYLAVFLSVFVAAFGVIFWLELDEPSFPS